MNRRDETQTRTNSNVNQFSYSHYRINYAKSFLEPTFTGIFGKVVFSHSPIVLINEKCFRKINI